MFNRRPARAGKGTHIAKTLKSMEQERKNFFNNHLADLSTSSLRQIKKITQWAPNSPECIRDFLEVMHQIIKDANATKALAVLHTYDALMKEKPVYKSIGIAQGTEWWLLNVHDKLQEESKTVEPIKELWDAWRTARGLPPKVLELLYKEVACRQPKWAEQLESKTPKASDHAAKKNKKFPSAEPSEDNTKRLKLDTPKAKIFLLIDQTYKELEKQIEQQEIENPAYSFIKIKINQQLKAEDIQLELQKQPEAVHKADIIMVAVGISEMIYSPTAQEGEGRRLQPNKNFDTVQHIRTLESASAMVAQKYKKPLVLMGPATIDFRKYNQQLGINVEPCTTSNDQVKFNCELLQWRELALASLKLMYIDTTKLFISAKDRGHLPSKEYCEGSVPKPSYRAEDGYTLAAAGTRRIMKEALQILTLRKNGILLNCYLRRMGLEDQMSNSIGSPQKPGSQSSAIQ